MKGSQRQERDDISSKARKVDLLQSVRLNKMPPLELDINELVATEGKTDCGSQVFVFCFFFSLPVHMSAFCLFRPDLLLQVRCLAGVPPVLIRLTSGRRQTVGAWTPSKSAAARPRSQSSLTQRSEGHDLDMCSVSVRSSNNDDIFE